MPGRPDGPGGDERIVWSDDRRLPRAPHGDYCPHVIAARRMLGCCLLALALMGAAGTAMAAGQVSSDAVYRIFVDYAGDRTIDGDYTAAELSAALTQAEDDVAFRDFASAVQSVYDRDILGLSPGAGPAFAGGSGLSLPEPPAPGHQPPWPLLVLTALGGLLVLGGAGSYIVRRARR